MIFDVINVGLPFSISLGYSVDVSAAFLVHVCFEDYSHLSMIKLESVLQEVNVDALAHDQFHD